MGTKHKHYDVIVAWANGEIVQHQNKDGVWLDYPNSRGYEKELYLNVSENWRVKPKRIKKEGWVNVFEGPWFVVHTSKDSADMDKSAIREKLACIRIEWEEEE